MPTTIEHATPESRFLAAFEIHDGHTLNGNNAALQGLRQEAIRHFADLGFPGRKAESWKYTPITKRLERDFTLALKPATTTRTAADLNPYRIPGLDAFTAVLVNGRLMTALSDLDGLPEGVLVCSLAEASEQHTALFNQHFGRYADAEHAVFTALNTAFVQDGLFVYVPKNTVVEKPLHVIHLAEADAPTFFQPRMLFVAERSAQFRMIESRQAQPEAVTFTNGVTEFFIGANAKVDTYTIQDEGGAADQVNTLHAYQSGDSVFSTMTITLSGGMVRNDHFYLPDAENCETHLRGLFLADERMHVDNHTLVDHAKPNCFSNELFKGVLAERAVGVFNGKVLVRRDAQQTNAYQSNKTVLLSDTARMYSKPELEIYADDVKCSHGATTGQLDPEAIFYLQSRGLTKDRARRLMLMAFARDVLDEIAIDPLRDHLDAIVQARLGF